MNRQDNGLVVTQHNLEGKAGNQAVSWTRIHPHHNAQSFKFYQNRFYFVNGSPRLCLDIQGEAMKNDVNVVMKECVQGKKSQEWNWNSGTGEIQPMHRSDLCLDIQGGVTKGRHIILWSCHRGGKVWKFFFILFHPLYEFLSLGNQQWTLKNV